MPPLHRNGRSAAQARSAPRIVRCATLAHWRTKNYETLPLLDESSVAYQSGRTTSNRPSCVLSLSLSIRMVLSTDTHLPRWPRRRLTARPCGPELKNRCAVSANFEQTVGWISVNHAQRFSIDDGTGFATMSPISTTEQYP